MTVSNHALNCGRARVCFDSGASFKAISVTLLKDESNLKFRRFPLKPAIKLETANGTTFVHETCIIMLQLPNKHGKLVTWILKDV